jgi:hypothetical protein
MSARRTPLDVRFTLLLFGCAAAGLGALRMAAPDRTEILLAAFIGAAFAGSLTLAGYEITRRQFLKSPVLGIQISLAVTTAKVIAFAAFLLTLALTTSLDLPALAAGLVGMTLLGEGLAIEGILRMQAGGEASSGPVSGGASPDRDG